MAGLLTNLTLKGLPIYNKIVAKVFFKISTSFTAAGLSGIFTRFPFNSYTWLSIPKPLTGAKVDIIIRESKFKHHFS